MWKTLNTYVEHSQLAVGWIVELLIIPLFPCFQTILNFVSTQTQHTGRIQTLCMPENADIPTFPTSKCSTHVDDMLSQLRHSYLHSCMYTHVHIYIYVINTCVYVHTHVIWSYSRSLLVYIPKGKHKCNEDTGCLYAESLLLSLVFSFLVP